MNLNPYCRLIINLHILGINLYLLNDPTWHFFQVQSTCIYFLGCNLKILQCLAGDYRFEPKKNVQFD